MKLPLLSMLFFAMAATAQQPGASELDAVKSRYKAEFDRLDAAETAALAPVFAAYERDLANLKNAAQSKGDLAAVGEVENLIKSARSSTGNPPSATASRDLKAAYASFQRNKAAALQPLATRRSQAGNDYIRDVGALEQKLTRAGQFDAAKAARDAKASSPDGLTEAITNMHGAVLKGEERVQSGKSFTPPLEVEWRFQTDGEVRLAYACEQLIFNWINNPNELRIDGGPVTSQHRKGEGAAPKNRPLIVTLTVLPAKMTVSLNGRERARWDGDFSQVNQQVGIRAFSGSTVKVDQVVVRKLK